MGQADLQNETPGTQQDGNMNIKGTGLFGKVEVEDAINPASISVKGNSGTTGFTSVNVEHTGLEPRKWKIGVNGKKFKGSFAIVDETSGKERLTIYKSGKVGIGIKRPKEKLDIAGNIQAKGSLSETAHC